MYNDVYYGITLGGETLLTLQDKNNDSMRKGLPDDV